MDSLKSAWCLVVLCTIVTALFSHPGACDTHPYSVTGEADIFFLSNNSDKKPLVVVDFRKPDIPVYLCRNQTLLVGNKSANIRLDPTKGFVLRVVTDNPLPTGEGLVVKATGNESWEPINTSTVGNNKYKCATYVVMNAELPLDIMVFLSADKQASLRAEVIQKDKSVNPTVKESEAQKKLRVEESGAENDIYRNRVLSRPLIVVDTREYPTVTLCTKGIGGVRRSILGAEQRANVRLCYWRGFSLRVITNKDEDSPTVNAEMAEAGQTRPFVINSGADIADSNATFCCYDYGNQAIPKVGSITLRILNADSRSGNDGKPTETVVVINPAEFRTDKSAFTAGVVFFGKQAQWAVIAPTVGINNRLSLDTVALAPQTDDKSTDELNLGNCLSYRFLWGTRAEETGFHTFGFPLEVKLSFGSEGLVFNKKFGNRKYWGLAVTLPFTSP